MDQATRDEPDEPQAHHRLHFANYASVGRSNRLIARGLIHPTLSRVYPLEETGQAAYDVHRNLHQGKVGVLCLSPERASASATRRCEPATSTRITGSVVSDQTQAWQMGTRGE